MALASFTLAVPVDAWAKSSEQRAKPGSSTAASRAKAPRQAKPAPARTSRASEARSRGPAAANRKARQRVRAEPPPAPSVGRLSGLHAVDDPLDLKSGAVLVVDADSRQVLFSKNPEAVLPIASITKLMTALVVVESGQPLEQMLDVGSEDVENTLNVRSRLAPGTVLSRAELLRLALMASENRAAAALARHHPGGVPAFVQAMNAKAAQLGMQDTRFVESTGLSPDNRASAHDLARLVAATSAHEIIREYSVAKESIVPVGRQDKAVQFRSTNGLIGHPEWDILLQKTGYISAAGRCLVMQASLAGRRLTMVLLDSAGKYARFGDAERLRKWVGEQLALRPLPAAVPAVPAIPAAPVSTGSLSALPVALPAAVPGALPGVVPAVVPAVLPALLPAGR
jgi:D-alanyl-D-alanine endopeptidase (penicillin-binding protein 7)